MWGSEILLMSKLYTSIIVEIHFMLINMHRCYKLSTTLHKSISSAVLLFWCTVSTFNVRSAIEQWNNLIVFFHFHTAKGLSTDHKPFCFHSREAKHNQITCIHFQVGLRGGYRSSFRHQIVWNRGNIINFAIIYQNFQYFKTYLSFTSRYVYPSSTSYEW